jgi:hypothetical protein
MRVLSFILTVALLSACGDKAPPKKKPLTKQQMNDLSVQMNTWD